jgi:erythromycin esterase
VALGESTHGTSGFYALRTAISKQMIQKKGFTVLVFENELGPSLDINKALLTDMPVRRIVDTFFSVIYRTKEMEDLLEWVRLHNRSSKKTVLLAGVDMQSYNSDMVRLKLLCRQDTVLIPRLLRMDTLQSKARTPADFDSLRGLAIQCAALFSQRSVNKSRQAGRDSLGKVQALTDRLFMQLINAYQKKVLEKTTGVTNATLPQDGNFRDSLMAANVVWLNRVYFPGEKMIVWAHDEHVMRTRNMTRSHYYYRFTQTMGEYLERDYARKYRTFAFLTGSGTLTGFDSHANPTILPLEQPPVDSYEYWLNSCNGQAGYVSLDPMHIPEEHLRLFQFLRWRALGFYGVQAPFREYNLAGNFDGLFFVRFSTPTNSRPIGR